MKPAVFRQRNTVQLSYKLPHHIYGSAVYPVRSPNGSRIVIYGHEEGIRIIWYGGRSYKQPAAAKASGKVNGASKNEPMVIDLSDDDEPAPLPAETSEFEEEEDEFDPTEPYREILRYIDIPFGTSATHLALPHISSTPVDSASDSHAPMLSSHLVAVAACADLTIRLVSLPLTPPTKSSIEPSTWNVQVVQIPASSGHQDLITNISITDFAEAQDGEAGGDRTKSRSRSGARMISKSSKPSSDLEWSFLIASTSCTGSGLLLIHRISLTDQDTFDQSAESLFPMQRQLLRSPLSACRLHFNPCPHPADRASSLLITLPDSGCVKVYQVIAQPTHARGRRGSAATMDSNNSSAGSVRSSGKQQGKVMITLYAAFTPPSEGEHLGIRNRLLDASWVLGGRAILALFEDGEWGVWDLEAAGPPSPTQTQNLVKGQSGVSGIQGGAQARFTIRGSIRPYPSTSSKSRTEKVDFSDSTGFAPMTPHTRKSRSDRLFENKDSDLMTISDKRTSSRGDICIMELPSLSASAEQSSKLVDESVILSYGDLSFYLPSLLTYWRAEVSGRGTFGTSGAARPTQLPSLRLGGEHIRAVSQFTLSIAEETALDSSSTTPDILAVTDHTLMMLHAPLAEEIAQQNERKQTLAAKLPGASARADELLLQRGELGIDGLDSMLDHMTNGGTRNFSKSVGFDVDEHMDVDMQTSIGTPTPKLGGRLRPVKGTPSAVFRPGQSKVRLFS